MRYLGAVVVASLCLLAACSNAGGIVSTDSVGIGDTQGQDGSGLVDGAVTGKDAAEVGEPTDDILVFDGPSDMGKETFDPGCEAGEGCFLDKCDDNSQCQSGWCVEHLGEGVCSTVCQEECPPGWSCEQVGAGPDTNFICVSGHANLCRPCGDGADCKSVGGAEDVCLSYGAEGSFCGGACAQDDDCPWGFSCVEAATVEGVSLKQCVADSGVCPCTEKSVALGLTTPCIVANEFGQCAGKRVCGEAGLSACDASAPAAEACNGIDDDCDGEVDEPDLVEGQYVGLCDDGNECTTDSCLADAGCAHTSLDEGECKDGDACTVGDHCEAGVCLGLPIACDDSNPCTDDACDGLGGCAATFNNAGCDDGDPCTVNDVCKDGQCGGYDVDCSCQDNSDCGQFEDGDLCNGTLYCDTSTLPYQCKVNEASIVACPVLEGQEAICAKAVCAPLTGECSVEPNHSGYACDDGDACTVGDKCDMAQCLGGVAALCNDNNPCTDDSCDALAGCQNVPNVAACNDGDPCTTVDTCMNGACVGAQPKVCDDGNICTSDSCAAGEGCTFVPTDGACDDGNACTTTDSCVNGLCKGAGAPDCNDNNPCTADACLPESGCANVPTAGGCTDGNPCTVNDACQEGICVPGLLLVCDDNNPCTEDACSQAGECVFAAVDGACDDGNACTVGDSCQNGLCVNAGMLDCDDDNVCTDDVCDIKQGCLTFLNSAPCDDGDVCTYGDHCSLGGCISAGELNCNDSNPCTNDSCNSQTGCEFVPNSVACDDGTACTEQDTCSAGICKGVLLDCDDNTVCTKDWCDAQLGCQHLALVGPCSDGTDCTVGDTCVDGACIPGPLLDCDDKNPCTDDSCHPQLGCQNIPNVLPCSDDDKCTVDDVCSDGACQPGSALECDDDNVCTDDSCAPDIGCTYVLNTLACDDGDQCTENDVCAAGVCTAGPAAVCDDSDPCTNDSCDADTGCVYEDFFPCCGNDILEAGEECDDGNHVGGDGCEEDCTEFTALDITFTNCGKTGPTGPSQGNCDSSYGGQFFLAGKVTLSAGIQLWTVPFTGTYRIEAYGAKGGCGGGNGARMRGDFTLEKGTELKIVVGQQGAVAPAQVGNGGGGGTYVVKADNTPLIIAGGGAGTGHNCENGGYSGIHGRTETSGAGGQYGGAGAGGTNGNGGQVGLTTNSVPNAGGGAGLLTNGGSQGHAKGGFAFVNGGAGGDSTGGFGGGGGSDFFSYGCGASPHGGGGGGGYSGGGGGGNNCNGAGGGAGSYNSGANPSNSAGANSGHGKVRFLRL